MPIVIENSRLKIGVDQDRGGAICWLGRGGSPENLLNAYDCGRFIQQSYYGIDDGSDWNGQPWRWNPVQGGSWQNQPAKVIECTKVSNNHIRSAVNPRNWGGQQLLEDVVMSANVLLQPDHIHLEHTFEYKGDTEHPVRIQELPAVFVTRKLSQLVFYDGDKPWTGGLCQTKTPGFPNQDFRTTEGWAAWVDPETREGVGIWVPWVGSLTAYRIGEDGSCKDCDCSYFAPTMRFNVTPGMKFTYHAFLCIGPVDQMRTTFSNIRGWALTNRPEWLESPIPGAQPTIPSGPAPPAVPPAQPQPPQQPEQPPQPEQQPQADIPPVETPPCCTIC